jgi:pimeloyl-ACP methyl ester carboxylesterase
MPAALPSLRSTSVFGRKICYYDVGRGPPLVLVHGVGGDADQWAFCFATLSVSHRVIALDLLGFGRSDKPLIDYRIAGYVEVLERFIGAIGIERASFVGHSLGGWIVAEFALQFPQKVDKLVLNDAAGIDEGAVEMPIDLNVSSWQHMRDVLEFMFHDKRNVTVGLVDLAHSLHLERNDGYTIKSVLATLAESREKLDGKLARLRAPHCCCGASRMQSRRWRWRMPYERLIPGARLQIIAECGHLPPWKRRTNSRGPSPIFCALSCPSARFVEVSRHPRESRLTHPNRPFP